MIGPRLSGELCKLAGYAGLLHHTSSAPGHNSLYLTRVQPQKHQSQSPLVSLTHKRLFVECTGLTCADDVSAIIT